MQEIVINIMNKFGYLGIFFLITLENLFPPIPSEIILTFSGYMTNYSNLNIILVILIATIGSLLGAIILFFFGKSLNNILSKFLNSKFNKFIMIKENDLNDANIWFQNKGLKSVFIGRFIPVIRSLISIPAGSCNMNFLKFLIYSFFGSLIWNSILVLLGRLAANNWQKIIKIINTYTNITIVILIFLIITSIFWFYKKKRKTKLSNSR